MARKQNRNIRLDGRKSVCLTIDRRLWLHHELLYRILVCRDPWTKERPTYRSELLERVIIHDCERLLREARERVAVLRANKQRFEAVSLQEDLNKLPALPRPKPRNRPHMLVSEHAQGKQQPIVENKNNNMAR